MVDTLQAGIQSFSDVQSQPSYQKLPSDVQAQIAMDFFNKRVATQGGYQKAPPEGQKAMFEDFRAKYKVPDMPVSGLSQSQNTGQPVTIQQGLGNVANAGINWVKGIPGEALQAGKTEIKNQSGGDFGQNLNATLQAHAAYGPMAVEGLRSLAQMPADLLATTQNAYTGTNQYKPLYTLPSQRDIPGGYGQWVGQQMDKNPVSNFAMSNAIPVEGIAGALGKAGETLKGSAAVDRTLEATKERPIGLSQLDKMATKTPIKPEGAGVVPENVTPPVTQTPEEIAQRLYHGLRSPDVQERTAAKTLHAVIRKEAGDRFGRSGRLIESKNPEKIVRKQAAKETLAHLDIYKEQVKEQARHAAEQTREANRSALLKARAEKQAQLDALKSQKSGQSIMDAVHGVLKKEITPKEGKTLERQAPGNPAKFHLQEQSREANRSIKNQSALKAQISKINRLLSKNNTNAESVLETHYNVETGTGTQHAIPSDHYQFSQVQEELKKYPAVYQGWAGDIDKAMQKSLKVKIKYVAEKVGETSTYTTKEVSPYAWVTTNDGKVGFMAHNPDGHETFYHLYDGVGSSKLIEKPQVLLQKGFQGVEANVYKGPGQYKIEDILSRPKRPTPIKSSDLEAMIQEQKRFLDSLKSPAQIPIGKVKDMAKQSQAIQKTLSQMEAETAAAEDTKTVSQELQKEPAAEKEKTSKKTRCKD